MPGYLSVAEIQRQQIVGNASFNWNINLPLHIDPEQLQVNTARVATIARIAGFSDITFGEYVGEQTTFEAPGAGYIFNNGTAAASGTAKAVKVQRERSFMKEEGSASPFEHYRWPKATIMTNKPEITSRIATHVAKGHDDHKAWAYELNGSLQRGLRGAAKQNLINPEGLLGAIMTVTPSAVLAGGIVTESVLLAGWGVAMHPVILALEMFVNKVQTGGTRLSERRWSLSASRACMPDRYAVAGLLAALPLVRHSK